MNRRVFLTSLVASSAIAACPAAVEAALIAAPVTNWQAYFEQWMKDSADVLCKCWEDQIIYGVCAYAHTTIYPYVRRIDPATLLAHTKRGGLFND